MSLHSFFLPCHPYYMLSKCCVSHPLQGRWKFIILYLQQFVFAYILNTMLAKKKYTAFTLQNIVHWALGPWMNPRGFHKSIIPLLVSALQAGGSSDCGHTAQLPVWMNCSKVMPCTKSLPGNKARQILMHYHCARNSASGPQTLAHLQGVFWHVWRPHAAGVVLVLIDNFWPVSNLHSSSRPSTL